MRVPVRTVLTWKVTVFSFLFPFHLFRDENWLSKE